MFKNSLVLGAAAFLVLIAASDCNSSTPPPAGGSNCSGTSGSVGCACYPNGTCNTGLACLSSVCVDPNAVGNAGSSAGGGSSSGIDLKACDSCAQSKCASDYSACKAAPGCETYVDCFVGCGTDSVCLSGCGKDLTAGNASAASAYETCALSSCVSDCLYVPTVGVGGSSSIGNAGSSSTSGGSTSIGGSSATGGSSSTGAGGGPPIVALTSGTNWLYLDAAAAPSTSGPNGPLGIEGVFYAYGDPCATPMMTWDPSTRCLSGTLCPLDTLGADWGVAIGFDFNNVTDVKHVWNATTAGATGIAWQMTNDFGVPVQAWIQNMDPSFNGTCSAASCSINGPGDGTPTASNTGQFSFATMTKDNWGGTGTVYVFNPADVSSLQFKITSSSVEMENYDVCIGALGVVR